MLETELEKLLGAYERYYSVNRETPTKPFAAQAVFRLHDEQYFLIRQAKISEADVSEIVFFATLKDPSPEEYLALDQKAWEEGLGQVVLTDNHRSTDVVLIILADILSPETRRALKKSHHYKSYRFSLKGWSHFRVIAYESATGDLVYNRQGQVLEKTLRNILP